MRDEWAYLDSILKRLRELKEERRMEKLEDGFYVVKPWKLMEEQYGKDGSTPCRPNIVGLTYWTTTKEDTIGKGRVVEVKGGQMAGFPEGQATLESYMVLGPYFEYGEECQVLSVNNRWIGATFLAYVPDKSGKCIKVRSSNDGPVFTYSFVRRKPKDVVEFTVKVNGREVDPETLSEESKENLLKALGK